MEELKNMLEACPKYIGTKIIRAGIITRGEFHVAKYGSYGPLQVGENPDNKGFAVMYEDGYISWSPMEAFTSTYRETCDMSFGLALEAAKKGKKIARRGWNGKDMFVFLREGRMITGVDPASPMGGDFESLPHLCMRSADSKCVVGWLASQTDMLSDDWFIVEEA
jgi:hypothetical protein